MVRLAVVTVCRGCDWPPPGASPGETAAGKHAKDTGHTVVSIAEPVR